MSFWEGFATQLNENIISRKERIAERNAEQRRMLRQEALKRQATVQKQREAVGATISQLRSLKMSPNRIAALVKNDPRMAAQIAATAMENNLTGEDLDAIIEVNEEYNFDRPLDELIEEAVPGFAAAPNAPKETKKTNILGAIFGLDDGTAEARMLDEELIPGVTGSQVIASRGSPTIATGDGGITLNLDALQGDPFENMNSQQLNRYESRVVAELDSQIRNEIQRLQQEMLEQSRNQGEVDPELNDKLERLRGFTDVMDGSMDDKLVWLRDNNLLSSVSDVLTNEKDFISYRGWSSLIPDGDGYTDVETVEGAATEETSAESETETGEDMAKEEEPIEPEVIEVNKKGIDQIVTATGMVVRYLDGKIRSIQKDGEILSIGDEGFDEAVKALEENLPVVFVETKSEPKDTSSTSEAWDKRRREIREAPKPWDR